MKYYLMQNAHLSLYFAIPENKGDAIEVVMHGSKGMRIKRTQFYYRKSLMTEIPVSEFYRAFVDVSNQLYGYFRNVAGDVFPIPLVFVEPEDRTRSPDA